MTTPTTNSYPAPIAALIGLTPHREASPQRPVDVADLLGRYDLTASIALDFSPDWTEDRSQWPLVTYTATADDSKIIVDSVNTSIPAGSVVCVVENECLIDGGIVFIPKTPKTPDPRQPLERAQ
jgi:hypothetical protein